MQYTMTVTFNTDRPLTDAEKESLGWTVYTQVAEPQVLDSVDGDWVDAQYQTDSVNVTTTP